MHETLRCDEVEDKTGVGDGSHEAKTTKNGFGHIEMGRETIGLRIQK